MGKLLLLVMTFLIVPISIALLYEFFKYRHRPKSTILLSLEPKHKGKTIYSVALSIIIGLIAIAFLFVPILGELRDQKIGFIGWVLILEISILFGIISLVVFQRRGTRLLQFTDTGIIFNNVFNNWDEIDYFEWEVAISFLGIILGHKKYTPHSKSFNLIMFKGMKWQRFYYPFNINDKQRIDEILVNKGKIKEATIDVKPDKTIILTEEQELLKKRIKHDWIVWALMFSSLVFFVLFGHIIGNLFNIIKENSTSSSHLRNILFIIAATEIVLIYFIRKAMLKVSTNGRTSMFKRQTEHRYIPGTSKYTSALYISFILSISIGAYGFILFTLQDIYMFNILAAIAMLIYRPKMKELERLHNSMKLKKGNI